MTAKLPARLRDAAEWVTGSTYMVVARQTSPEDGLLHYSTAQALARARPEDYVIERIGRQRVIRRIARQEATQRAGEPGAADDAPKRRPKDDVPRPHRVQGRFSEEENALLTAACAATGLSPGAYVALAALQAARNDADISEFTITWPPSWPADERVKHLDVEGLFAELRDMAVDFDELEPGESITITRNQGREPRNPGPASASAPVSEVMPDSPNAAGDSPRASGTTTPGLDFPAVTPGLTAGRDRRIGGGRRPGPPGTRRQGTIGRPGRAY